jgi:hypothetical protein
MYKSGFNAVNLKRRGLTAKKFANTLGETSNWK